jgi:uncharacterized membrane protein required for colicin V production
MEIGGLRLTAFDLVVVTMLGVGVFRGRSRGMSLELLDLLQWLIIVVVGALVYQPVGQYLVSFAHLSVLSSYVLVYLLVIVSVRLFFGWIKRLVGEKLVGSDVFGSWEYYLGMAAGATRFACYLIVGMALLNAKYVSPEEMASDARMQQENFGDISFPTIGRIQQSVFVASASGSLVKKYLGHELIVTGANARRTAPMETLGRQRERAVMEVMGDKR